MERWALYSILASAAFGLSAIPLRHAVSRMQLSGGTGILLLTSCLGSLIGALLYYALSAKGLSGIQRHDVIYGGISGLISITGSLLVIKALSLPSSNTPNVMSLVNTNVLFTIIFSMAILREIPEGIGLLKMLIGGGLILAGSMVLCR